MAFTTLFSYFMHLSVYKDLISEDPDMHGFFFCPIILGSDKTTVSVATSHNEYWPVYLSIGGLTNSNWHAHRNGLVLLGFFAIPKSKLYYTHKFNDRFQLNVCS